MGVEVAGVRRTALRGRPVEFPQHVDAVAVLRIQPVRLLVVRNRFVEPSVPAMKRWRAVATDRCNLDRTTEDDDHATTRFQVASVYSMEELTANLLLSARDCKLVRNSVSNTQRCEELWNVFNTVRVQS